MYLRVLLILRILWFLDLTKRARTLYLSSSQNSFDSFRHVIMIKSIINPTGDSKKLVDGRVRKAYYKYDSLSESFTRGDGGLSDETVINYPAYDIHNPPDVYRERCGALRRTEVIVRAGEFLYLPFGWWHEVTALPENGFCASCSMFFDPFYVRLQPKCSSKLGVLIPNPAYRGTCELLGIGGDSSDGDDDLCIQRRAGT